MLPSADALFQERLASGGAGSPPERCLPRSFQHQLLIGEPFQIIQGAAFTTMLFEEFNHYRQIFTDGREHPTERTPSWFGYSIGKWEGDTFVVDTVGFRGDTWLDLFGHPATEQLRTVERYTRPDFGHLKLTITIEDSGAYQRPWSADVPFQFQADTDLFEHICESEKSSAHIVVK